MDITTEARSSDTVVVVGAGPTGLWLAAELALAGIRTVVLEKRSERSPNARALGMMPRTLEVLALRDAVAPFLAAGRPVPAWHFGLLTESIRFDTLDTPFPYMLLVPQTTTEHLLEERARGLGVEFVIGAAVTGLDQHDPDAPVTVTYDQDGVQRSVSAALVIGCDGARSTVRTLAEIPFEGEPSRVWGFVGDVLLDAPPAPGTRIVRPDGALIVAPLPDGRFRLTGWDPEHQSADEQLDLATLRDFVRRMAGSDFGAHDPSWLSRFGDENRLAATFRSGRVLLAGDAAHIHWPTGGLGLNAGIQDAMSLGWRAAAVVRGTLPDTALDDYATERRAFGESLRTSTLTQSALITAAEPATLAIRATFERLVSTPDGNRAIGTWLAGLQPDSTQPQVRVIGTPVPEPQTVSPALSALFAGGRPVLLVADPALRSAVDGALEALSDDVVVASVEPATDTPGAALPGLALFRPDGIAAWTLDTEHPLAEQFATALSAVGLPVGQRSHGRDDVPTR